MNRENLKAEFTLKLVHKGTEPDEVYVCLERGPYQGLEICPFAVFQTLGGCPPTIKLELSFEQPGSFSVVIISDILSESGYLFGRKGLEYHLFTSVTNFLKSLELKRGERFDVLINGVKLK